MAEKEPLLKMYDEMQSQLGTDKITYDIGLARNTPYSIDSSKEVDEQILTAEKFRVGRGGQINDVKYSDRIQR
jgi:hypothetical protein